MTDSTTTTVTPKQAVQAILCLSGAAYGPSPTASLRIAEDCLDDAVIDLGQTEHGYRRDAMLRALREIIATDPSWLEYIEGPEVDIHTTVWEMWTGETCSM